MAENKEDFKYKVIGWTLDTDRTFPTDRNCSKEKYAALLEEIRANGYVFGGDVHEDYCPVFNDGTKLSFSWRGWGGVMAAVWNPDDTSPYKYSLYYMDSLIDPKRKKRPKDRSIDEQLIEKKVWHEMEFCDADFWEFFTAMRSMLVLPFAPELEKIKTGDFIEFKDREIEGVNSCVRADEIFKAQTVEELLRLAEDGKRWVWQDLAESLGYEKKLAIDGIAKKLKEKFAGEYKDGFWLMEFHTV